MADMAIVSAYARKQSHDILQFSMAVLPRLSSRDFAPVHSSA